MLSPRTRRSPSPRKRRAARSAGRKARFGGGRHGSLPSSPRAAAAAARDSAHVDAEARPSGDVGLQPRGSLQRGGSLQPGLASLRRSTSQSRLAWQGGAGEEDGAELVPASRQASKLALQQQAAPAAPGGLRHSKSFGGHLAELMQVGWGVGWGGWVGGCLCWQQLLAGCGLLPHCGGWC